MRDLTFLVTGATGLIGGEVAFLLAERGHQVTTLIRAVDDMEASERLHFRAKRSSRVINCKLKAIAGDITFPKLGLSEETFNDLAGQCNVIIHAAAETRFTAVHNLIPTNVMGTKNLTDCAHAFTKLHKFVHVSSAAVVTSPENSVVKDGAAHSGFSNTYVQSKRLAENILMNSRLPLTIARPSVTISNGILDAEFAKSMAWFLLLAARGGVMPLTGLERLDIVPVSFVAASIVALATSREMPLFCNIASDPRTVVTIAELCDQLHTLGYSKEPIRFKPKWKGYHKALELYLPFIRANVIYETVNLNSLSTAPSPITIKPTAYVAELLSQLTSGDELTGALTA